ncbi:DNA methyltransferase [Acidovorax sp. Leaf76]|uniref:DNA cytosine methyltransferase n=1 Tax=unclassified Acidovorax TaxID=2684926 RepID=UPI0006F40CB3|nr:MULTISPECIES: DNA cytosine methyltransferase [unclassified Acidovorax]KQO24212.1 DNA methyltransferase [Acidovorax sp. Leaf76]KQS29190.1 DNA methyltransferase [Acidovorax sp. Leaf191]
MNLNHITEKVTHFHVCGGLGSGAAGFNDADPSIGPVRGEMVCVGGVDVDPRACRDFQTLTGVHQACIDLFTVGMYQRFHGRLPPAGWREATPQDFRDAAHGHFPDLVFTSMPCKGFSGLLSAHRAATDKYAALNELVPRGVMLTMEAFADNPPGLFIFENVPRVASRGRPLLDLVDKVMGHYGYVGAETVHDCGELGEGLAQSRRRMLKVFRHVKKVPPFLYEPTKRRLHAVGDVLRHMPLPGDEAAGPMHRVPALQWKTWVRLAFVEAGSDWRSLNRLAIEDGQLRDYIITPQMHAGVLGVNEWGHHVGTVTSRGLPNNGNFAVADPRFDQSAKWKDGQALGVRQWGQHTGTVPGQTGPLQGAYSVADPRHHGTAKHSNEFAIVAWDRTARAVTSAHGTGQAVADPRPGWDNRHSGNLRVQDWAANTGAIIAGGKGVQGGWLSVADPRTNMTRVKGDHYLTGGHYGVVPWAASSGAVSASACHDNGNWSVADPREGGQLSDDAPAMPAQNDKMVCRITSMDGTWHRPFTTLELAALQSLIDPEEWFAPDGPGGRGQQFVLDGASDQRWREGIGNAVPRKAAKAIGQVMGQTILLARAGETFVLGSTPIWVRPLAVAVSVAGAGVEHGV